MIKRPEFAGEMTAFRIMHAMLNIKEMLILNRKRSFSRGKIELIFYNVLGAAKRIQSNKAARMLLSSSLFFMLRKIAFPLE